MRPSDAVAAVLPWSLFLKIQWTLSPPLPSLLGVTSLSVPKPALTKALTSVAARFWRALSTAGPWGWRPSAFYFFVSVLFA